jgi:sodium pump decarboxylase gamma subunit
MFGGCSMNFLMEVGKEDFNQVIIDTKGFMETLTYGAKMVLIGMIAVFAVLCLIWFCLYLFGVAFNGSSSSNKTTEVEKQEDIQAPVVAVHSSNDEEIIAVIAAAIAMAESENEGAKFRVVSFRRK